MCKRDIHRSAALLAAVVLVANCSDADAAGPGEVSRAQAVVGDAPVGTGITAMLATNANVSVPLDGATRTDLGSPDGTTIHVVIQKQVTILRRAAGPPSPSI